MDDRRSAIRRPQGRPGEPGPASEAGQGDSRRKPGVLLIDDYNEPRERYAAYLTSPVSRRYRAPTAWKPSVGHGIATAKNTSKSGPCHRRSDAIESGGMSA